MNADPVLQSICTLAAIIGIAVVETVAIRRGMNGKLLAMTIAAIAGLGGFCLGTVT